MLLDDPEGLCAGLIDRAGGRSRDAHAAVEQWLAKQPKVSGAAAQPQATRDLMRFFDTAEKAAEKAGDSYVTVERHAAGARRREGHARPARSWPRPA